LDVASQIKAKITVATWSAFTQDSVWNGLCPGCVAHLWYQMEGNKAMTVVNAPEAMRVPWPSAFHFDLHWTTYHWTRIRKIICVFFITLS